MYDDLIKAIAAAINAKFNAAAMVYKIYDVDIEQGLKEPCFLLHLIKTDTTQYKEDRYNLENSFEIIYIPEDKRSRVEMQSIVLPLFKVLRFVEDADGNIYAGSKMNYEIVDGILHFYVNYDFTVRDEPEEVINMATLEQERSVRDGG